MSFNQIMSTHLVLHCTTRGLHQIAEPTRDPRHAVAAEGARAAAVAALGAGTGGAGAADQGTARK